MRIKISGNRILYPDGIRKGVIYIEDEKIIAVEDINIPVDFCYDAKDCLVTPGLIDIHTHGACGVDYAQATPEQILKAVEFQVLHGATSVMPTVTSSTYANTFKALENIEKAMQDKTYGKCIIGAHLEGPYFAVSQCGGQDKSVITPPIEADYVRLVERFAPILKRWDYAPEYDKEGKFASYLQSRDILPSAGHTEAKYLDMLTAKEKGCKLVTHLYSCTSTITREGGFRKLGVTECAYLWDDLYVEIIADGKHLPLELIQLVVKLKPIDKIILITDSLKVTGSQEKYSSVGNVQCIIEDGVCKLLDRTAFAGSIATAERFLKVCVQAGCTLKQAVQMGSENPARLFALNEGKIEVGYTANILVFNDDLDIDTVFMRGKKL